MPSSLLPRSSDRSRSAPMSAPHRALSKAPVLGWRSFWPGGRARLPSVADLQHRAYTTSGRAALLAALQQLGLPPGSTVLVPTYHCPTMIAPVLCAGLIPIYFPIGPDGLPLLDGIPPAAARNARAMFVAHYFGLPKSLTVVQAWCRSRGIALVEDCAHSYFGQAGELPVGQWGDYATASLSKFFPVADGGLLASARHPLKPLQLVTPGARAHVKSVVDVVEYAALHGHLAGIRHLLAPMFWIKNRGRPTGQARVASAAPATPDADALMIGCDMARVGQAPGIGTLALHRGLPTASIVASRRANFTALAAQLMGAPGARLLTNVLPGGAVPYVCPIAIEGAARADAVYASMRAARLPVFRWDRIWPGTPDDPQDSGARWSRQMLQLLCHQNLSAGEIAYVAQTTLRLLHSH